MKIKSAKTTQTEENLEMKTKNRRENLSPEDMIEKMDFLIKENFKS